MDKKQENKRVLLGRRIRAIRKAKGLTQEQLGTKADLSYKYVGEIERGQQNPSFDILVKIFDALEIESFELFRFDQDMSDRKDIEARMLRILSAMAEDDLRRIYFIFRGLFPQI